MRVILAAALLCASVPLVAQAGKEPAPLVPILGFAPAHAAAEHRIESAFQSLPSPARAREWHRIFSAQPHPAASARNNELARIVAREWRRQGWDNVALRRYEVLHSSPRSVSLEMTAPRHYQASLREDAYEVDPATGNPANDGAYFGYSASGDVTAELVYAHSGNPEDYEVLKRNGISVKGKIVIVRYSNPYSYRGFKALTAEREGAAALLIYSDPAEDGYTKGKVFPDGPWGPESHIQHGAITYDYIVPGDPTTPGWPSVAGAKRIPLAEARSLPKIIALPLSWRDAKPLLENMSGPEVLPEWGGALPITYRYTGGVSVHVHVDMDTSIKPYTVVEARIRGSELPDEWVLIGNHRDAWVDGGVDPVSGTASMLELTRSLGQLKKNGHRPRRTLVVCSWDGEEYALTGSTEWGEQFEEQLQHKLVAYLNVDEAVAGAATTAGPEGLRFDSSAVASLSPMLIEASKEVRAPSGKSLYEAWRVTMERDKKTPAPPADAELANPRIGSGSDHTVFLNHLGRPVINLGFVGDYGVYHSSYDDHYWMTQIGDPRFEYHVALTQIWGLPAHRRVPRSGPRPARANDGRPGSRPRQHAPAAGSECPTPAGGVQLAGSGRHTRAALVSPPALCGPLQLRSPGISGPHRSRRGIGLDARGGSDSSAGGGPGEEHPAAAVRPGGVGDAAAAINGPAPRRRGGSSRRADGPCGRPGCDRRAPGHRAAALSPSPRNAR